MDLNMEVLISRSPGMGESDSVAEMCEVDNVWSKLSRVSSGTKTESNAWSNCRRLQGKDCSCNPFAFPPSLEGRCRRYESREGRGRAKHDCMDAGGRATHGAVAEEARTELSVKNGGAFQPAYPNYIEHQAFFRLWLYPSFMPPLRKESHHVQSPLD